MNHYSNHQNSKVSISFWDTLRQTLQRLKEQIGQFMIDKSDPYEGFPFEELDQTKNPSANHSVVSQTRTTYDRKVSLYGYMSSLEEQRDWLEKIYRRSE